MVCVIIEQLPGNCSMGSDRIKFQVVSQCKFWLVLGWLRRALALMPDPLPSAAQPISQSTPKVYASKHKPTNRLAV